MTRSQRRSYSARALVISNGQFISKFVSYLLLWQLQQHFTQKHYLVVLHYNAYKFRNVQIIYINQQQKYAV